MLFMYLLPPKMHKPIRGSEVAVVLKGSYILESQGPVASESLGELAENAEHWASPQTSDSDFLGVGPGNLCF